MQARAQAEAAAKAVAEARAAAEARTAEEARRAAEAVAATRAQGVATAAEAKRVGPRSQESHNTTGPRHSLAVPASRLPLQNVTQVAGAETT